MVAGRGTHSPALVISLVRHLPDTSLTAALISGGRQYYGWGHDRALAAAVFDAINANTRMTGQFKKPPKFNPWPRPGDEKKTSERATERVEKGERRSPGRLAELFSLFRGTPSS